VNRKPLLEAGYVARAHGIRGEIAIKTFDPDSTALLEVKRLELVRKDGVAQVYTIAHARPAAKETLLVLEGVSGRTPAEKLVGSSVRLFREDLPPPAEGEFFQGDLVGLAAVNEAGEPLGTVEEIWETGPVPNLVIRRGAEELVVPFVDEFVTTVDLAGGRIVVRPPVYLE
jgi:16S rRNA processing protein RimM